LGYYYVQKNEANKSLEYWNKVLSVDPGNKRAQEAINLIKNPGKAAQKGTGAAKAGTTKKPQ
jgi:hypothetical protein